MDQFFHGTQVDDVAALLISIAQVNGSTIALVGTAPEAPAGMSLVSTPNDVAAFGESVFDGRTIPHALDAILAQGASQVIVINCAKASHLVAIPSEAVSVPVGFVVPLSKVPVGPIIVSSTAENPVILVSGVDYTYKAGDKFFTILTRRTYVSATALTVAYSWFNNALVHAADIIGALDGGTGARTGIKLLDLCFTEFGLIPKILIAPVWIETETVCDALLLQADNLRARVPCDAPNGTLIAGAVASRGPLGTYVNFDSSNPRLVPVFPYVFKPDPLDSTIPGQPFPYSAYFAGMWAASINRTGLQQSPSNLPLVGFKKTVLPISSGVGNANTDTQVLNAAGISTIFSGFGAGVRSWGNRSASFPSAADITTFLSVLLVQDILDESVLMASLAWQDKPLDLALVDSIVSAVNALINSMILTKALLAGEAYYDKSENTAEQIATGFAIVDYRDLPPPPGENIKFRSFIDISLFQSVGLSA